ncbi:MAG TPA: efflux RND transporter periplasmic adaptor subunit [Candidatus Competibacteraceae bacterium]|nr:efflux RND transporter periplasmic adaptor subunit [Candidatus Competibacteraceae bacterium]
MKGGVVLALGVALAAGAAVYGWTRPRPVAVQVRAVELGAVEATVANTRAGTVKACRRAKLSPPGGGQVSVLAVRKGDEVAAGQLLLELWNEDLKAQLTLAESQLAASTSRAEETCLTAEVARRDADRLKPLERRALVSAERIDQAETEARARAAACSAVRAAVQVSTAQIAVARAALERTRLRAPFAGVVAEITGEVGEIVTPSPPGIITPPAVDLIDHSCLYVSAPIDEVDAPAIRVGQAARITLDAFPGQVFGGRVRRIAPYVLDLEKQARTVEVEAEFVDAAVRERLLPGYSADLEVILERRERALRVPSEALLEGDRALVLGGDGRLRERRVQAGLRNWNWTEVRAGLAAGERVVVSLDRAGVEAGARAVAEP